MEGLTRARSSDEVQRTLAALSTAVELTSLTHACILHAMEPRRRSFYRAMEREFGLQFTACSSNRSWLLDALLGTGAVAPITNSEKLPLAFARVGEQAMAGLCFVRTAYVGDVLQVAPRGAGSMLEVVRSDPQHLIYQVDEDTTSDAKVLEIVQWGPSCPEDLRAFLHS
jgi:hypothetical protein